MTNETLYGILFGFLLISSVYCLNNILWFIKYKLKLRKLKKTTANVEKADLEEVKKCRHEWENITLGMLSIPVGKYNVCKKCGYIAGLDYKLNKYGLEAMHEGIKKRELVKQEQSYLENRLEEEIERHRNIWIDQNLCRITDMLDTDQLETHTPYLRGLLEDYGVYLRKTYKESIEKVYEEETQRRR